MNNPLIETFVVLMFSAAMFLAGCAYQRYSLVAVITVETPDNETFTYERKNCFTKYQEDYTDLQVGEDFETYKINIHCK